MNNVLQGWATCGNFSPAWTKTDDRLGFCCISPAKKFSSNFLLFKNHRLYRVGEKVPDRNQNKQWRPEYLTRGKICSISLFHGFCSALLSILWPDSILEQALHHIYISLHIYYIVYIILYILEPALHHISYLTSPFGEQENRTINDWTWDQDWISQCS